MYDLIIKNGNVITSGVKGIADLGIKGGKIVALGDLSGGRADLVMDADDLLVLPGAIDAHVHFHLYVGNGLYSADDFYTGGKSAVLGGVTTVIDFVHPVHGEDPFEAHEKRLKEAEGCPVDYAMFYCINERSGPLMDAVPELISRGIAAFKVYTTYKPAGIYLDDGGVFRLFKLCGKHNGLVSVHAENDAIIETGIEEAISKGELSPVYHAKTRPPVVESEAVRRLMFLAKNGGAPVHILHVSSKEGLQQIRMAKAHGAHVTGETCPHYLLLGEEKLEGADGCLYTMTPPLRHKEDNDTLWEGLRDGTLDFVTTDHCPFMKSDKEKNKNDFTKIPKGIGGVGTLLPLLYSEGVRKGRISLERMVELLCENPAKHYGIFPEKGCLLPGADADIVLLDPNGKWIVTPESTGSRCDYSVYDGMELAGKIRKVLRRGRVISNEGKFLKSDEPGNFIKRKTA
ncbi:MAG: dihydropyrimidinase [Chloroflexi bacterium]|nr:dihydropyrimidinase [Chloroflexota bacterium]